MSVRKRLSAGKSVGPTRRFKKTAFRALGGILALAAIGAFVWYVAALPPIPESDIVSRSAFHWHPELAIYVKGEKLEIPPNIGLGVVHEPIHTHEDSDQGIVHMEFEGLTLKQNATLGQFFKNWNRDMRSFGPDMKMTVNGEENTDYENYVMRDGDRIELKFQ